MDDQQQKHKRKECIRSIINFLQGIATTLFLLAITIALCVIVIYRTRSAPLMSYAIVFDAGSSHTEMFVYYWPADKSEGLGTTSSVNQYFVCPVTSISLSDPKRPNETVKLKAISDFEQHLDLLDDYFAPCLNQAVIKIPANRHKFSPIFLGATAGMRLAKLRNATRADQVLETIREIFLNYPFQFVTARQVRILTGMEEAIDGWITTNIFLEKFKHRHEKRKQSGQKLAPKELDPDMVGVLDLGGASTQVTFTYTQNDTTEPIPGEFTTNITLFDTVYNPYAHSYLCWGKNEAMKRYRARLLNAALNVHPKYTPTSSTILIRDPCLARGINDTLTKTNLFGSSCTANEKQQFKNNTNATSFVFVGSGNALQCRERLMSLFDSKNNDKSVNCSYKKDYCTFDHTFQPKIPSKLHFIGLSGYYYVFHNLAHGMPKSAKATNEQYKLKDFSKEELERRRINVCETHYSILYQTESMNKANEHHKRALCFDAWYVWLLLTVGIGFTESDLPHISFANSFPTGKVGWTLGYMINQTNYIPAEYREKRMEKNQFVSWIVISIIVALISCIFLIITCQTCIRRAYYKRTQRITTIGKDGYTQPNEQSLA